MWSSRTDEISDFVAKLDDDEIVELIRILADELETRMLERE